MPGIQSPPNLCRVLNHHVLPHIMQGREWLSEAGKYRLFRTHIRRTEKVDQSTYAAPLYLFSRWCGASKDYVSFVSEYLQSKNVLNSSTFLRGTEGGGQCGKV